MREYRRASTTAVDASLKPLMQQHLRQMEDDLRAGGFAGELLIGTSAGGCQHVSEVASRPVQMLKSGPAMAPVAGQAYTTIEKLGGDAIVCDTGGTTFDVGLVRDGNLVYTRDSWLGRRWIGHMVAMSTVDVRSIGAGGGSIAWIDAGGLLRVGPQSAGAMPGPACYGRGGDKPTVTDAGVVLGVGDGRLVAAAAVAGRARHRARRLRADAQQAAGIDPGDRAAAGADGAHVDRGHCHDVAEPAPAEPAVARVDQVAVAHEADVEGGAAGVADDGVAAELLDGDVGVAGDRRHGRTGLQHVDRAAGDLGLLAAADRSADEEFAGKAGGAQIVLHLAQVLLHQRLQRGVDRGRRGAAVFAHDRDRADATACRERRAAPAR